MSNFSLWLEKEIKSRNWKQADLARASSLDSAAVSMLITGRRGPGETTCLAIAKALGYPPEVVFRAAGILPQLPPEDSEWEEWKHELRKLTQEQRARFLRMMRAESEYEAEQQRLREASKRRKTGPLPNL